MLATWRKIISEGPRSNTNEDDRSMWSSFSPVGKGPAVLHLANSTGLPLCALAPSRGKQDHGKSWKVQRCFACMLLNFALRKSQS